MSEEHSKSSSALGDVGHTLLDVAGALPGYGEVADMANAAWYANEGDYLSAGFSLISLIPIVGDLIGKGGKLARKPSPKASKAVLDGIKNLDIRKFLDRFRNNKALSPHLNEIQQALEKWQKEVAEDYASKNVNSPVLPCKKIQTSSGAILKPNPNKTTTVLGRYDRDLKQILEKELDVPKSVDFGPKQGSFNLLNVPDELYRSPDQFWDEFNKPFLDNAIKRGDDIIVATDPRNADALFKADGGLTGFGREIKHLMENGYSYDPATKMMTKP